MSKLKLVKSIEETLPKEGVVAVTIVLDDGSSIVIEAETGDYYTPTVSWVEHVAAAPVASKPSNEFVEDLLDALPPAEGPPATERQANFIRSLCEERQIEPPSIDHLTVPQAGAVIDRLLAIPKPTIKAPEGTSKVAPGYYAIDHTDGETCFYRVQRAKEGEHAGKTFVMRQSGDNFIRIPKTEVVEALEAILKDPVKAGVRYGREIGRCCKCNRTLTDDASRKDGIGPECKKTGWNV